jgi:hypothetical protein
MYQLSHLLSDQKYLLEQMMDASLHTSVRPKSTSTNESNVNGVGSHHHHQAIETLFDRVDGISVCVNNVAK